MSRARAWLVPAAWALALGPAAAQNPQPVPAAVEPETATPPLPERLRSHALIVPVEGVMPDALANTFDDARSQGRVHEAIDIMAARGTPVLAADDGTVEKLFDSEPGGLTVYQFDPSREVIYYYAHLDRRADGLAEGQVLRRGEVIGYVGSTGNASADAPHLHFAVMLPGPEKRWWEASAINPYPLLTRPAVPAAVEDPAATPSGAADPR